MSCSNRRHGRRDDRNANRQRVGYRCDRYAFIQLEHDGGGAGRSHTRGDQTFADDNSANNQRSTTVTVNPQPGSISRLTRQSRRPPR